MKFLLLRSVSSLAALAAIDSARADLNPALVGGNARWVAYANVDGLRQSTVGRELVTALEQWQSQVNPGPIRLDIPKVVAAIGSVTLYGSNFEKDPNRVDGALIVQGQPQLRKIVEALLIQGNVASPESVAEVPDLGYTVYAVSPPKDKAAPHLLVALPPEPIVIVTRSREQLIRTLELYRGHGASLGAGGASELQPLLGNAAHALIFAASAIPSDGAFGQNAPQARILRMTQAASAALGEDGAKTFAKIELMASSPPLADKLLKIVDGMTAMLSLAESSDQQMNDFLNSAAASRSGDRVTLQVDYASDRLAQMIRSLLAKTAPPHRGRPFSATEAGSVVATWTTPAAPAPDGVPPVWKRVNDVVMANGSIIIVGEKGAEGAGLFDQMRIFPHDAAPGSPAPWLYRRKGMMDTGVRQSLHRRQVIFPGEDGSYSIEVHVTPRAGTEGTVSVRVINLPSDAGLPPAPPAPPPPAGPSDAADSNR